jgi:hypothetical protein
VSDLGSLVGDALEYLRLLAHVTWLALQLDEQLVETVAREPSALALTAGVAVVAGASTLLGQSVMLFVNRVRPWRFGASLLLNGVLYTLGLLVWGATIWLLGTALTGQDVTLGAALRVACLSAAPLVFGFLVLIPYFGLAVDRVLHVWSFLITVVLVQHGFQLELPAAVVCTGLGWLLVQVLTATVGRPLVALGHRLQHRVAGSSLDARVQDILVQYGTEDAGRSPPGGRP